MAERLTFTLTGRDELSRVLNGTADSADRLRLRLSGITADSDGQLRDLRGRFLGADDAARRLTDSSHGTRDSLANMSDAAGKLGEALKANLISLAPAAIPAAAGLAGSAAAVAAQFGAVAVAAGVYALALGPQISAIGEAAEAEKKWQDAVAESGAASQEAVKAQVAYQKQLAKLPPETQQAAAAVGLLKDAYQDWSDSLAGDVMGPFNKGIAVANALLPRTTGLVKGSSAQFDRLITMVGGAISTPGFDALNQRFTNFTERTLRKGIDGLTLFFARLQAGEVDGGPLAQFFDYAQSAGPVVWDTLENVAEALAHILEAGSGVGIGMLEVINVLSGVVAAVPPDAIATLLQLAIAIKAVRLAAAAGAAAQAGLMVMGTQIMAMRTAAAGAPGAIGGVTAAISGLSRGAKLAMAGTGIGLLLIGLDAIGSKSRHTPPDVDKLSTSLATLGRTGAVSGEALQAWGKDLAGLTEAMQLAIDPTGWDQVQQSLTSLIGMDSTPVKNAKEDVQALDEALAGMVSGGKADLAAAALDRIVAGMKEQGLSSKEITAQLDDYQNALKGQALEQQLAAESMGLFGRQAQEVQARLDAQKSSADGLRQSIQALNDVNRQGLSGMIGFEAALDAATKAAKENAGVLTMQGGQLVLNTEKQRAAATALNDLAAKTDAATGAARESGASWSEVSGIYERGRQQLIRNADQMGLNRDQAKALADQILATPNKTAFLRGDIKDLEQKIADAKERLRKAPSEKKAHIRGEIRDLQRKLSIAQADINGLHGKTVTVSVRTAGFAAAQAAILALGGLPAQARADGGLIRRAAGGPIPGYPGGGLLHGPGTTTSDSILLWGSTGEYMIKASSVQKYGTKFMDALNEGRLPVGRGAPSPGRPAAVPAPAPGTGSDRQAVTYNVYPRQSVINVDDLRLIQRQEEARQRVGRPR
ncbi:hypothetical protein [Streptomyces sp. ML-6]|uniref:hypothetical protein n=1 Tax=Streptomyces sp. ML-6 TaxID=2982693 RepID=UPI0024C049D9|nr:hypothetical protein [Streptomyces sp. ML-6]MDK0520393.1 hypothetical protein [Streptomyces sp. ML-6]